MKLIKLTLGKFAQVDDDLFEYLNQWKWYAEKGKNTFYAKRNLPYTNRKNRKSISMHRLIMGCEEGDGKMIDHKDRDGLNCQMNNMRFCTRKENGTNRASWSNTGFLGVNFSIKIRHYNSIKTGKIIIYKYNLFTAQISSEGKQIYLGKFTNAIDAALAYNEAAKKYHGEFANLNNLEKFGGGN